MAEQILDLAFKSGVKVRQDPDLTALLAQFDVESPIPLEALEVVGEILYRVYRANNDADDGAENSDAGDDQNPTVESG